MQPTAEFSLSQAMREPPPNFKPSFKNDSVEISNFQVITTPKDGDCFYTALSYGLFGAPNGTHAVRECIARQVWRTWFKVRDFVGDFSRNAYYDIHRKKSEYATEVQIQAAAEVFDVQIFVSTDSVLHTYRSAYSTNPNPIVLNLRFSGTLDSGHYDFLAPSEWRKPTWGWTLRLALDARRASASGVATRPGSPKQQQVADALERENHVEVADPEIIWEILEIRGNYDNLFKIWIKVDGLILLAALDTGATRTIINRKFVTDRSALRKCNIKLRVANEQLMDVDGIYTAELCVGDDLTFHHNLICAELGVDLLIGNDLHSKYKLNAIINFRTETATFALPGSHADVVVDRVEPPGPPPPQEMFPRPMPALLAAEKCDARPPSTRVLSTRGVWAKAGSVTYVRGVGNGKSILPAVFEPRKLLFDKGLESLECFLIDKIEIPVLNILEEDVYIPAKTMLGRVCSEYANVEDSRIYSITADEAFEQAALGFLVLDGFETSPSVRPRRAFPPRLEMPRSALRRPAGRQQYLTSLPHTSPVLYRSCRRQLCLPLPRLSARPPLPPLPHLAQPLLLPAPLPHLVLRS